MKQFFFPVLLMIVVTTAARAAVQPASVSTTEAAGFPERGMVEKQIGRKLGFGERIAYSIAKRKWKQEQRRAQGQEEGKRRTSGAAVVSAITGALSWVLILGALSSTTAFLALLLGLTAIITGIVGIVRVDRNPEVLKGKGWGIAGLILGIGFFILVIGVILSFGAV